MRHVLVPITTLVIGALLMLTGISIGANSYEYLPYSTYGGRQERLLELLARGCEPRDVKFTAYFACPRFRLP
jgi:hypothetical protein